MNEVSIGTLALVALYLIISFSRFGVTESISATWYKWYDRDYSAAFVWFCLAITAGAWFQSIYPYKHATKAILMLAGFFIGCVGIAATYKDGKVEKWHYAFSAITIALGFASLTIEYWGTWRCWAPVASFVILSAAARRLWPLIVTTIVEVLAIVLIFSFL